MSWAFPCLAILSKGSIEDARELAKNLGIRWETIPIQDVFEHFKATLQPIFKAGPRTPRKRIFRRASAARH